MQNPGVPTPRKRQISLEITPYYHCISRCVRQSFLCGKDPISGYNFEHRRQWIVDRMRLLSTVFAIEICAYAVMSNHYHVVIRVDTEASKRWSSHEVAERWLKLFSGPRFIQDWLAGMRISSIQLGMAAKSLSEWRRRLSDVSWFMRCLNEPVARLANHEDGCTGRFWEGRFKSQALLDERALLACMAYVDLNPIRAAIATAPETSDFTSIQSRIRQPENHGLIKFADETTGKMLPYTLKNYLELVDWAARCILPNKRGAIPSSNPPILERLAFQPNSLLKYLTRLEEQPMFALGTAARLNAMARSLGLKFIQGKSWGKRMYTRPT